jgi:hypothetical protein
MILTIGLAIALVVIVLTMLLFGTIAREQLAIRCWTHAAYAAGITLVSLLGAIAVFRVIIGG